MKTGGLKNRKTHFPIISLTGPRVVRRIWRHIERSGKREAMSSGR